MNTAKKIQSTQNTDTVYNPFDYINEIISDTTLSGGARRVFIRIITASGYKGFCYPGIPCLCGWTGLGATQLRVYLRELVTKGNITIIHRRGRSNIYQLTRFINKTTEPLQYVRTQKRFIKRKRIKSTENVISFQPQEQPKSEPPEVNQGETIGMETRSVPVEETNPRVQQHKKPVPHYLIREIINLTNDKKSFGLWYKFVSKCDEQTVYQCISALRTAIDCDQVNHRGKYLVGIMKQICPELFQGTPSNYQPPAPKPEPEPTIERNEALNAEGLANIKAILFGKKSPDGSDANRLSRTRNTRVFGVSNG